MFRLRDYFFNEKLPFKGPFVPDNIPLWNHLKYLYTLWSHLKHSYPYGTIF